MKDSAPLHKALRQLSRDVRELVQLAASETDESWQRMVETVKREVSQELAGAAGHDVQAGDDIIIPLVTEIYDHLSLLILRIKDSQDRLRKLATRDLLTGLYNRNYFNEVMVRDIQKARRRNERLSFIILDIDNFKHINDTHGHLHGDGVIKACAAILRESVRKSDFLCRYGGDEFVIVTQAGECQGNGPLLSRINENVLLWNGQYATADYSMSLSIGCAVWEPGRDIVDVLHEADGKMYEMKKRSRR